MDWKPGDEAIIETEKCRDFGKANGKRCVLVRYIGDVCTKDQKITVLDAWHVRIDGEVYTVAEQCLRKPYDGFKPGSWEQLDEIWNPLAEAVDD